MNYFISAITDIGLAKDKNQDSYNVRIYHTPQGPLVFAILCDGMGGLSKGEVASATVVKAFCTWLEKRLPVLWESDDFAQKLCCEWIHIVESCNKKIQLYGQNQGISLGTTVTAVLFTTDTYYFIHVGDTRIYEITDSLLLLAKDQTLIAREIELGRLTIEQAQNDPRQHILIQCVGASQEIYPEFKMGKIKENAVYILCSDGFRHKVSEEEMYKELNSTRIMDSEEMKAHMKGLVELSKQRQEKDNITVIGIKSC